MFGERSRQVDQILHVLGRGVALLLLLLHLLLTFGESESKGQSLHTLAGIRVLRLRDEWQLLAVGVAEMVANASAIDAQVSGVGGAHGQRVGVVAVVVDRCMGMGILPQDTSHAAHMWQCPGGLTMSAATLLMRQARLLGQLMRKWMWNRRVPRRHNGASSSASSSTRARVCGQCVAEAVIL